MLLKIKKIIATIFMIFSKWCVSILKNFKRFSIEIIALASVVTSVSVLMSVPNGIVEYYKTANWEKNVKIIRFSSIDYIVIYNGNPKPIFVNRFEYKSYVLEQSGTGEINQTIPPYSYMNFQTEKEKIGWDTLFNGDNNALENAKRVGLNKGFYRVIVYNKDHHLLKLIEDVEIKPRTFDFDVNIFVNFEEKEKAFPIKSTGMIAIKY